MSALPCPVVDPFTAADQAYATISTFLRSEEACQVKHSDLERQLEGMGRELMRKLLQAHLDLRQPGKAMGPVRDTAGTPLTPTPAHTRSLESIFGTVEVTRTGYRGERPAQSASARWCAQSAAREVLAGSAAPSGDRSGPGVVG
jgi:hypothetical protein